MHRFAKGTMGGIGAFFATCLLTSANATTVDVVSAWGLQSGPGSAAANSAAVAAHVSGVASGTELHFPAGEYYFSDTLDLSAVTSSGITISASETAVLHSGIMLGGASDVTVKGLEFRNCAGPAIVADGTDGLVVTNCTFADVVGAYADGKKYNFAFLNVTGLNVVDSTYSFSDGHLDGRAYFDGGTQTKLSEAYAGATVINVKVKTAWAVATNGLGLTAASFSGKALRKIGAGQLTPNDTQKDMGITNLEILQGIYYVAGDGYCGTGYIRVHPEGHLHIDGGNKTRISSRWIYLSGSGGTVNASTCSVRFMGTAYWGKAKDIRWYLEDDASIYIEKGANGVFYQGQVHLNGHTLTISRNESGTECTMRDSCKWYGGGTVVVEKAKFTIDDGGNYTIESGSAPKFVFKNSAIFAPGDATACNVVKDVDFATGTKIEPASATALAFDSMIGVPTITANVSSMTIKKLYTARAADLLKGRRPSMDGALVFGPNAKWAVDDIGSLSRTEYTLCSAKGGITGAPARAAGDGYVGWRSAFSDTVFSINGRSYGLVVRFF